MKIIKANGHKAVIHSAGASALGKMLIKYCKSEGIKTINLVRNKKYFDELTNVGSDVNLDMTDVNFTKDLQEKSKELSATVCFDAVAGELTGTILTAMPNGSSVYVYGVLSGKTDLTNINAAELIFKDKKVSGYWVSSEYPTISMEEKIGRAKTTQSLLKTTFKGDFVLFEQKDFEKAIEHSVKNASAGKAVITFC